MSSSSRTPLLFAAAILVLGVGGAALVVFNAPPPPAGPPSPTQAGSDPTGAPDADGSPATPHDAPTPVATEVPATTPTATPADSVRPTPSATPVEDEDPFAGLGEWEYDEEAEVVLPPRAEEKPLTLRTSDERVARFREEAASAAKRLETLRAGLSDESMARAEIWKARTERAKAANPFGDLAVVALDAQGMVITGAGGRGGQNPRLRWREVPTELLDAVLPAAADRDDASDLIALGRLALRLGRVEPALKLFERAERADAMWIPTAGVIRHKARSFEGDLTQGEDGLLTLSWNLTPDRKLGEDFGAWGPARVEASQGGLRIQHPDYFRFGLSQVRGAWTQVRVAVTLGESKPPAAIGFGDGHASYALRFGPAAVTLVDLAAEYAEEPLASIERACGKGTRVAVTLTPTSGQLQISVSLDDADLFSRSIPWTGPARVSLGSVRPGSVRFEAVRLRGTLDPLWTQLRAAEALDDAWRELREQELARRPQGELPLSYDTNSAEDPASLEGVPEGARGRLIEARAMLLRGDEDLVYQYLQQASDRSREHGAAHVVYGRSQLHSDPLHALALARKSLRAVADVYEAHVLRADALRRLGRLSEARSAFEDAIALRADYAPAWLARAWLDWREGSSPSLVREALTVARSLAPDDPQVVRESRTLETLLDGPPGLNGYPISLRGSSLHVHAPSEAVATPAGKQVAAVRARCAALFGRQFPAPPDPRQPSRVVVFSDPAQYTHYLRETQSRRPAAPYAGFDAGTGEVLVLRAAGHEAEAEHALRHEAVHQWFHERGATLPGTWLEEGLAELLAGVTLGADGEVETWGAVDAPLRDRLRRFGARWSRRMPLFDIVTETGEWTYAIGAGKDTQTWLFVRWLAQDAEFGRTWRDYMRLLSEGGRDPERERSELLEQAFMATFYEADLVGATPRWEAWVAELAQAENLKLQGD